MVTTALFIALVIMVDTTYAQVPTECSVYQTLSSADRSQAYLDKSNVKCDNTLSKGWYRFTGPAGLAMPTSCTPNYACGTHASGWLSGSHPTVADGAVDRTVCYSWTSGCCQFSNNIRVRNCTSFYVYELDTPPTCDLRYCGNGAASV